MDRRQTIDLSEVFASIQGEGKYLGVPTVFVRTSGCNLRCKWGETICDTPASSWRPQADCVSIDEVRQRVQALRAEHDHVEHLALTGGEPMLQPHLGDLAKVLEEDGWFVCLETNGTIAGEVCVDFVSISPKLQSSVPTGTEDAAPHDRQRYQRDVLRHWIANYDYQLKFVINTAADEAEISAMLDDLGEVPPEHIYLMPQGVAAEELQRNSRLCGDICLRQGWHFTPRAHIELYGNVPGT